MRKRQRSKNRDASSRRTYAGLQLFQKSCVYGTYLCDSSKGARCNVAAVVSGWHLEVNLTDWESNP